MLIKHRCLVGANFTLSGGLSNKKHLGLWGSIHDGIPEQSLSVCELAALFCQQELRKAAKWAQKPENVLSREQIRGFLWIEMLGCHLT